MSLERGVMLCLLNQELFPEPGRPMASTTTPLEGVPDDGAAEAGGGAAISVPEEAAGESVEEDSG